MTPGENYWYSNGLYMSTGKGFWGPNGYIGD